MKKRPEVAPEDFLKRDFVSSPRFMLDPVEAAKHVRIRYEDKSETVPVTRSVVGSVN